MFKSSVSSGTCAAAKPRIRTDSDTSALSFPLASDWSPQKLSTDHPSYESQNSKHAKGFKFRGLRGLGSREGGGMLFGA